MLVDGAPIVILSAYFDCRLKAGGENAELLNRIRFLTRGGTIPFILAADFNMTPAVLRQ
jgi:hypothetical protein